MKEWKLEKSRVAFAVAFCLSLAGFFGQPERVSAQQAWTGDYDLRSLTVVNPTWQANSSGGKDLGVLIRAQIHETPGNITGGRHSGYLSVRVNNGRFVDLARWEWSRGTRSARMNSSGQFVHMLEQRIAVRSVSAGDRLTFRFQLTRPGPRALDTNPRNDEVDSEAVVVPTEEWNRSAYERYDQNSQPRDRVVRRAVPGIAGASKVVVEISLPALRIFQGEQLVIQDFQLLAMDGGFRRSPVSLYERSVVAPPIRISQAWRRNGSTWAPGGNSTRRGWAVSPPGVGASSGRVDYRFEVQIPNLDHTYVHTSGGVEPMDDSDTYDTTGGALFEMQFKVHSASGRQLGLNSGGRDPSTAVAQVRVGEGFASAPHRPGGLETPDLLGDYGDNEAEDVAAARAAVSQGNSGVGNSNATRPSIITGPVFGKIFGNSNDGSSQSGGGGKPAVSKPTAQKVPEKRRLIGILGNRDRGDQPKIIGGSTSPSKTATKPAATGSMKSPSDAGSAPKIFKLRDSNRIKEPAARPATPPAPQPVRNTSGREERLKDAGSKLKGLFNRRR